MQALTQDQFVNWLVEINKEEKLDRRHEKGMLTKILAIGMRDHFDFELARSQACANHEAAEHAQATLASLRQRGKPTATANKAAREAWIVARSSWSNFYLDRLSLESMIKRRIEQMQQRIPLRDPE